jgi:hypothetical protein
MREGTYQLSHYLGHNRLPSVHTPKAYTSAQGKRSFAKLIIWAKAKSACTGAVNSWINTYRYIIEYL